MSTVASIVSLKVTPKRSSDHSFNIAGIIETRTAVASLGAATVAYSARATLYGHLADPQLDGAGNPTGRLIHDSAAIRQKLLPVSAYVLSNEVIAADLDQAILRRQTQFLTRNQFSNRDDLRALLFSADHFPNLALLASKLQQPNRPIDTWLVGQLSALTQTALQAYQGSNSDPSALLAGLELDLNTVIQRGQSIYNIQHFAGVTIRKKTWLLRAQTPQGNDLVRLNRLLLEDAYPLEVTAAGNLFDLVLATYPEKVTKLQHLLTLADSHFQALDGAYNPGGGTPAGVTNPKIVMGTRIAGIGGHHHDKVVVHDGDMGGIKQTHVSDVDSTMRRWDGANWVDIQDALSAADPKVGFLSQQTISISENEELRHPNLENQIRHERVTADLLDEILAESAFNLTVPNLPQIWANELTAMDLEIRKLQVQFIETFLAPRLAGNVTATMKEAGDNVRAGEAVFRIEGTSEILLTGQIKCRAPIAIGQACVVETANVFASNPAVPLTLNARVVSVRGYDSEKDRWNVVLEANNPAAPNLPLGYDFEPHTDYSKITF